MNEIEFYEEDHIPQPPDAVKIEALLARVYPDGRRVRLDIRLTPFMERPNIELTITNAEGHEVASLSIIESMHHVFEMTAHLRGPQPRGKHTVRAELFYESESPRRALEAHFDVPPSGSDG